MACGACEVVCPADCVDLSEITTHEPRPIPSEFDESLSSRPSIYVPFAQAVPNIPVIDKDTCVRLKTGDCGACEAFCEADAIAFDQEDSVEEVDVGAIIVATGFELFDSTIDIKKEEVQLSDDWAFKRGTYTMSYKLKSGGETAFADGKFLTINKQQKDGSWKIYCDCFNSNVPPE